MGSASPGLRLDLCEKRRKEVTGDAHEVERDNKRRAGARAYMKAIRGLRFPPSTGTSFRAWLWLGLWAEPEPPKSPNCPDKLFRSDEVEDSWDCSTEVCDRVTRVNVGGGGRVSDPRGGDRPRGEELPPRRPKVPLDWWAQGTSRISTSCTKKRSA